MELLHLKRESSQQDWNAINASVDNYLASNVKKGFVIIWYVYQYDFLKVETLCSILFD